MTRKSKEEINESLTKNFTAAFPKELKERLDVYCKKEKRNKSNAVVYILTRFFESLDKQD